MKVSCAVVFLLVIAGNASALTGGPILDEHGEPARLTHTMALGSVSDDVVLLRRVLVRAGVAGRELVEVVAPNVFDVDVEAAVKRFQMSYGLVTDGRKKRPPLGHDHAGYGKLGKVTRQGLNLQQAEAPDWLTYNARIWQARGVYLACRARDASDPCLGPLRHVRTIARRRAKDYSQLIRFWPEAALAVSLTRPSPAYGGELFATGLPAPGSPDDLTVKLWGWIEREGSLDADINVLNVDDFDVGASGSEVTDTTSGRQWPDTSAALAGAKRALVPGLLYGEGEDATIAPLGPPTVTQLVEGLQAPEAAMSNPAQARTTNVIVLLLDGQVGLTLQNSPSTMLAAFQQVSDWYLTNSRGLQSVTTSIVRATFHHTGGCFGAPDIENALTPAEWDAAGSSVIAVVDPSINVSCPYGGVTQSFYYAGRYHVVTMLADYTGLSEPAVAAHELGHAIGLGHSGSCFTTWDRRGLCNDVDEYGDPVSIMGNAYAFPNTGLGPVHAAQLGWVGASDFVVAGATTSADLNTTGKTIAVIGRAVGAQPSTVAYWLEHLAGGWYLWINPPRGTFSGVYVTELTVPIKPDGGFNLSSGEAWTDGYNTSIMAVGGSLLRVTRGAPQPTPQPTPTPQPGGVSCWYTSNTHQLVVTGAVTTLSASPGERIQVRADSQGGAWSEVALGWGGPASNTNVVQPWPFIDYDGGPKPLTWQYGGDFHVQAAGVFSQAWQVHAANGSTATCVLQIVATYQPNDPICHIVAPDHIGVNVPFSPSWALDVGTSQYTYGWAGPIDKLPFLVCQSGNVPCQIGPSGMWGNLRFTQAGTAGVVLEARNGSNARICSAYVQGE